MVPVLGFCIDSTEVTVAHYKQFLSAMAALPGRGLDAQIAQCSGNTDFKPEYWYPSTPKEASLTPAEIDALPVGVVDWCDARAFCAWSGKRLCGKVGGGELDLASAPTPAGEWFAACSHNGLNGYPYGPSHVPGACNDSKQGETEGRTAVSSFPACAGGYDGIFDMSGNLSEWLDACGPGPDASTVCAVAGGSWNFPGSAVYCGFVQQSVRSATNAQRGMRCCADP
jgi:formylglycine-generating enzyme required for sulfatase activity